MGLYWPCLRDGGGEWGDGVGCREGEELEAILLSQWEAGWKRPSFLAFCHRVMRKLHDQ